MQTRVTRLLSLFYIFCVAHTEALELSTFIVLNEYKMRSVNCLLLQNAHSDFFLCVCVCEESQCIQSVIQKCVCAYSKTVTVLGSSSGYAFRSYLSEHFICT